MGDVSAARRETQPACDQHVVLTEVMTSTMRKKDLAGQKSLRTDWSALVARVVCGLGIGSAQRPLRETTVDLHHQIW
jgi:hypothetical protein